MNCKNANCETRLSRCDGRTCKRCAKCVRLGGRMKCIHPSADVISFEMLEETVLVIQVCHHCKKQFDEHVDYDEFPIENRAMPNGPVAQKVIEEE